jgi:hypothetical protein
MLSHEIITGVHVTSAFAPSDEDVGRQIIGVFLKNKVRPGDILRRNHFAEVRDADFQRGINKAVEKHWIRIKTRDCYTYELTNAGFTAS